MSIKILVAEDEDITLRNVVDTLRDEGFDVTGTQNGLEAQRLIEADGFEILITDIKMPGLTGIDLLKRVREQSPETKVIIITGFGSVKSAVDAMRMGAFDYITKPFDLDELVMKVKRLEDQLRLQSETLAWRTVAGLDKQLNIIAQSAGMRHVLNTVEELRDSDVAVFLTGETGVGKSLIAKSLHLSSTRSARPFISINCATLTEDLLASELFGHERGAFTGAVSTKQGLVEIADKGTLFLDEIAELPTNLQAKLLKAVEEGEFYRVGSTRPLHVDVRFIASTNQNVRKLIADGKFREDLYYRLNVMEIHILPLRERLDDIKPLCQFFLRKHLPKLNRKIEGFTPEAIDVLMKYSFPGNVRELENIIERAIILEKSGTITPESLPQATRDLHINTMGPDRIMTIEEVTADYARKVLKMMAGNRTKASEHLGISRTSLWKILKEE